MQNSFGAFEKFQLCGVSTFDGGLKMILTDEQVAELEKILGVTRRWIILGDGN